MLSSLRPLSLTLALMLSLAAATAISAVPVLSQTQLGPERQVELTQGMVEAFLATYPEIEALGAEFERQYGYVEADPEDPAGFALAYSRYTEAKERIESLLAESGIGSLEDWAQIAYSLMIAYSFAEGGENIGSMDEEMAEAIDQIRDDPSIPAAQRDQLVASLEAQMEQLSQLRPSPGNIALAAQYAADIRAVVDHEEED